MSCKACNIGKRNDYNNVPVSGLIAALLDVWPRGCIIDWMGVRNFPVLIQESPVRQVAEHHNGTAKGTAPSCHLLHFRSKTNVVISCNSTMFLSFEINVWEKGTW